MESAGLKKRYTACWMGWCALLLVAEFSGWAWLWVVCAVAFVAIEGVAIYHSDSGDTLSEQVWRFYGGKKARIPLLVGVLGWLCVRLYDFGKPVADEMDIGRLFLCGGIGVFLALHFFWYGRMG